MSLLVMSVNSFITCLVVKLVNFNISSIFIFWSLLKYLNIRYFREINPHEFFMLLSFSLKILTLLELNS